MMKKTILVVSFLAVITTFLIWRMPVLALEHQQGEINQAGQHSHAQKEDSAHEHPAGGDQHDVYHEKHEHTPEMEFFHQEFSNEPWRISTTIPVVKRHCLILGGVLIVLLAFSIVSGILQERKRRGKA